MAGWSVNNPTGAHGYSDVDTVIGNLAIPLKATEAIAVRQLVQWATTATSTGQVQQALTNGSLNTIVGIALQPIASGGVGNIALAGACYANLDTVATVATLFNTIRRSAANAGSITVTTQPAANEAIGYTLATNAVTNASVAVFLFPSRTYWT